MGRRSEMKKTVDGLILRESIAGESDKLLTVLTAEGKIYLRAKGVRSIKSKNLSLCRAFNYGNFEYYEKNGMCWLSGGSSHSSFFALGGDVVDFALAAYICDIAVEITGEETDSQDILRVTLNSLYAIDKTQKNRELIKGAFELYAAAHSGFAPELDRCRKCTEESAESFFVDIMNGNCLCERCLSELSRAVLENEVDRYAARNILLPVSASAITAARYVLFADPARLFAFELTDKKDLSDFSRLAETYLLNHLERGFDTLDFYKSVQKPLDTEEK